MQIVCNGNGCTNSPATPSNARLTGLRALVLALVTESDYASETEKVTTTARIANCQSIEVLAKWYRNAVRELADREENVQPTPVAPTPAALATASQKEDIIRLLNHPLAVRQEKTKCLLNINRLTGEKAAQRMVDFRAVLTQREAAGRHPVTVATQALHHIDSSL